ncbi:MAG: hypothetical protein U1E03_11415 [Hyphomonadaceae bacterium]
MGTAFEIELRNRISVWERLGCCPYADGSKEYGRIPHAGSHAFLHALMPAPSVTSIAAAESTLKLIIPDALRQLWGVSNGLRLFHLSLDILGLPKQFSRALDAPPQPFDFVQYNSYSRPARLDPKCIVCGGYGFDGSAVLLNDEGEVFVSDQTGEQVIAVGSSLTGFVLAEFDRLSALFDADGRLTCDEELTVHPALRRLH